MSRAADALPQVSIRTAVAAAARDLLERPLPLIASNVVWGSIAFAAWITATISLPAGILLTALLAWPATAVATVAAGIIRGADVSLGDALRWPIRRPAVVVLGALAVTGAVVGLVNLHSALGRGDHVGVAFATLTAWGLIALGVISAVAWPLLGDPRRGRLRARDIVGLAVRVVLVRTPRVVATCALVGCLLAVSAVLAAALLTMSVSLAALVLARVVLPIADALET